MTDIPTFGVLLALWELAQWLIVGLLWAIVASLGSGIFRRAGTFEVVWRVLLLVPTTAAAFYLTVITIERMPL